MKKSLIALATIFGMSSPAMATDQATILAELRAPYSCTISIIDVIELNQDTDGTATGSGSIVVSQSGDTIWSLESSRIEGNTPNVVGGSELRFLFADTPTLGGSLRPGESDNIIITGAHRGDVDVKTTVVAMDGYFNAGIVRVEQLLTCLAK